MEGADRGDAPDAGLASAVCLLQPLRRQPPPACRPPPPTAAHIQRAPTGGFFFILYCEQSRGFTVDFAPAQGAGAEEELFRALSNGARRRGSAIHASRHNPATPPPHVEFCRIRVRYMRRHIYISPLCLLFAVGNPVCTYLRSSGGANIRRGAGTARRSGGPILLFFVFTYRIRHKPPKDRWYIVFRLCINNMCHVRHILPDMHRARLIIPNASCVVPVVPVSLCSRLRHR